MTEIVSPFAQFFGTDGAPLNNGAIYIGAAYLDAQSNPIPVYWDDALTIPAIQPIRTLNGYAVRNGTPARIFCNAENFSMTVQTSTGRTVWSIQDATSKDDTPDDALTQLAQPNGSSLVGFTQTGTTASQRTAQDKMRDIISVKDYGAVGNAIADDTDEFNQAGPGSYMPAGTYNVDISLLTDDREIFGSGEVQKFFTWRTIGQRAITASYGDPQQDALRHIYTQGDAVNGKAFFAGTLNATTSIPSNVWTPLPLAAIADAMAALRPSLGSASSLYIQPGTRAVRVSGFVTFAANATSVRGVALYKNGAFVAQQITSPVSGFDTTISFDFLSATANGDYFDIRAYHVIGSAINVTAAQVLMEPLYRHPSFVPGKRLLIYQGAWETQETAYGGYRGLLNAVSQYDVLALSHVEAFGAAPYPLLPNPNGILDGGYQKLKRLIHDYKDRRPAGLVYGYVSAAIDAPTWDAGGNPTNNTWTSTTYPNLNFWMDLWMQDRHLPIDGFFFDHYATTFMGTAARDASARIAKERGKKLMVNITSPGAAPVQWAAECPYLTWGDYLCVEGFYRDNGADTLTATNALLAEMEKHEARGLLLAAVNEETAGANVNPTNVNNLNGASLFNNFYMPGWCYQYGRVTYDTIGTPAI